MNFFHIESLPHSLATMNLLVFLLFIAKTLFIAYLAALIGGTSLSYYFRSLYLKKKKNDYLDFSLSFFGKLNNNFLTPLGLGLAPLFAVVFIYIQFSDNPNNVIISNLILATILFPIGLIVNKIDFKKQNKLISQKNYSNYSTNAGLTFLSLFIFLVVALVFASAEVTFFDFGGKAGTISMSEIIFSLNGTISFISVLALAFAFAIINFLQFEFKTGTDSTSNDAFQLTKEKSSMGFVYSSLALLVFLIVRSLVINSSFKGTSFWVLTILGFIFLLISLFKVNSSKMQSGKTSYTLPYLAFLVFLMSFGGADSMLFREASDSNISEITKKFDVELAAHKAAQPAAVTTVNAEDIFFDKCLSCHQFDKKATGPALKDVVVKYKNKKDKLAEFILNPTKVDPNFPAMPNQALKPAEAKAMAEYLFKELGIK